MNAPVQAIKLPEPQFPMLTRMVSNSLFPSAASSEHPMTRAQRVLGDLAREPQRQQELLAAALHEAGQRGVDEPITWTVSLPHPLVPDMKVVRMFVDRGGVEVYSISADGRNGVRNLIPMSSIRLIEEAMPLDVFVEELAAAESGDDDDDDDEPSGEPEQAPGFGTSSTTSHDPGVS